SLVNVARKDGIDAESALRRSCDKFRKRWSLMESYSRDEGKDLGSYGIDGLDDLWERAKEELSGS
ncbi:MAG: nucleoside triphosphate pyrophosphohydrolase, partial [Coriobacteriales bacterium]